MKTPLDDLVDAIAASTKYHDISADLVRQIGAQELIKRRNSKEAIKATKNKLHQIAGPYLADHPDYDQWLALLTEAVSNKVARNQAVRNQDHLRPLCRQWLTAHASTRERVLIFDQFSARIFAGLPSITSLLDLACGLNPLTIPWMQLSPQTHYFACDLYDSQAQFFNQALPLLGVVGNFTVVNLLAVNLLEKIPQQAVDVALLLKTIPCLEQVDKAIGTKLLAEIDAKVLIISFPARSLGGRFCGMAINYEAHFQTLLANFDFPFDRIEFENEIVFRVYKGKR